MEAVGGAPLPSAASVGSTRDTRAAAAGGTGTIYVVATPIGNLEDITFRAARILREVDLVAAEDTRRTRILLRHLGIDKPMISYYDAVESARTEQLLARVRGGESIALVSDAGTPLVADPGYRLVRAARDDGIAVVPIPGPSAPLALLACAGLPTHRFSFLGFLPTRRGPRRKLLHEVRDRIDTLVLFETAPRLAAALADMAEVLGPRRAAIGRELTKAYEEVIHGTLIELAAKYASQPGVKGEIAIAIAGREHAHDPEGALPEGASSLDQRLREALAEGASVAAAARSVAADLGISRRDAYQRALALRSGAA